ncbi:MAG: hypothetical protein N2554_02515 [Fimbriimonadales bacterium]|nr:hypothetical protein [Fimbriimonadales bacterium]
MPLEPATGAGSHNHFAKGIWDARPGGVNGDDCVDDSDLLAVLFAFGCGAEDANGDGAVDDAELLEVLFHFDSRG